MKDPRTVLDSVRRKVSPNAKLLVVWLEEDSQGCLLCAQANLDQSELATVVESLRANVIATRIAGNGQASVPRL